MRIAICTAMAIVFMGCTFGERHDDVDAGNNPTTTDDGSDVSIEPIQLSGENGRFLALLTVNGNVPINKVQCISDLYANCDENELDEFNDFTAGATHFTAHFQGSVTGWGKIFLVLKTDRRELRKELVVVDPFHVPQDGGMEPQPDAGPMDAGEDDGGMSGNDGGPFGDAGSPDASMPPPDAGPEDAGQVQDAGMDAGTTDAGAVDGGCVEGSAATYYNAPTDTLFVGGACQVGIKTCINGQFVITKSEVVPTVEVCDGLDHNCNGIPNDGCAADGGPMEDAGQQMDASMPDRDAGPLDAGAEDAGMQDMDAGPMMDAGEMDGGSNDAGEMDAGEPDASMSTMDAGTMDAGAETDAGDAGAVNDGGTDGGCTEGATRAYYSRPTDTPPTVHVGICSPGEEMCQGGVWVKNPNHLDVTPQAEVCNGLDDDCNGMVDDNCAVDPSAKLYFKFESLVASQPFVTLYAPILIDVRTTTTTPTESTEVSVADAQFLQTICDPTLPVCDGNTNYTQRPAIKVGAYELGGFYWSDTGRHHMTDLKILVWYAVTGSWVEFTGGQLTPDPYDLLYPGADMFLYWDSPTGSFADALKTYATTVPPTH